MGECPARPYTRVAKKVGKCARRVSRKRASREQRRNSISGKFKLVKRPSLIFCTSPDMTRFSGFAFTLDWIFEMLFSVSGLA